MKKVLYQRAGNGCGYADEQQSADPLLAGDWLRTLLRDQLRDPDQDQDRLQDDSCLKG